MAVATRMTADEFRSRGTQLIRGEVVVNQPAWSHQCTAGEFFAALREWARGAVGRGAAGLPVDVRIGEQVYASDVWLVREERRPSPGARELDVVPDLVVEVRSPSTWRFDIAAKRETYEAAGVAELWLVDVDAHSVIVYRRSTGRAPRFDVAMEVAAGDELTSPLLPGFVPPVADVFAQ